MESWISSWIHNVSEKHQFLHSLSEFQNLLQKKRSILGPCYKKIDSLVSSMTTNSTQWALCYKKPVMDLLQHTTSIGESFNASLKKHSSTSMASLTIANSAVTCVSHSEKMLKKRKMMNTTNSTKARMIHFGDQSLNMLTLKTQQTVKDLLKQMVRTVVFIWSHFTVPFYILLFLSNLCFKT